MPTSFLPASGLALGVGLTDACNLACAHCYRSRGGHFLDAAALLRTIDQLPVRSVNFGTGENALHPGYSELIDELARRGVTITMTTNGYSAQVLSDARLQRFAEVEFSIDYPLPAQHDAARGPGNWALVAEQMARCTVLGVRTTLIAVLMSSNYEQLPALAAIAGARGALLRVNVFQPVVSAEFALSYPQFWQGYRDLLAVADLVTCGEPVLRAALGIPPTPGAGCGSGTVRITPHGQVQACVYQRESSLQLGDLADLGLGILSTRAFARHHAVPQVCRSCPQVATCGGGCTSRRSLAGDVNAPDPFCPFAAGQAPPKLGECVTAAGATLAKASSACTTVFRWRARSSKSHEKNRY